MVHATNNRNPHLQLHWLTKLTICHSSVTSFEILACTSKIQPRKKNAHTKTHQQIPTHSRSFFCFTLFSQFCIPLSLRKHLHFREHMFKMHSTITHSAKTILFERINLSQKVTMKCLLEAIFRNKMCDGFGMFCSFLHHFYDISNENATFVIFEYFLCVKWILTFSHFFVYFFYQDPFIRTNIR